MKGTTLKTGTGQQKLAFPIRLGLEGDQLRLKQYNHISFTPEKR